MLNLTKINSNLHENKMLIQNNNTINNQIYTYNLAQQKTTCPH